MMKRILFVCTFICVLLFSAVAQDSMIKSVQMAPYPVYKNPGYAFMQSMLVPGLGQFYNRQTAKGFICLGGSLLGGLVTGLGSAITEYEYTDDGMVDKTGLRTAVIVTGTVILVGSYLYSLIDAPISANKLNKRNGVIVSFVPDVRMDKLTNNKATLGATLAIKF